MGACEQINPVRYKEAVAGETVAVTPRWFCGLGPVDKRLGKPTAVRYVFAGSSLGMRRR